MRMNVRDPRPHRRASSGRLAAAALLLAATAAACVEQPGIGEPVVPPPPPVRVSFSASVTATNVALVTLEVRGDGIPTALVATLDLSAGRAAGALDVPVGAARSFTVRAFDWRGVETHRGAATVDVAAGRELSLSFAVSGLTATIPLHVRAAGYAIALSGGATSLGVGQSAQFVATLTDPTGATVPAAGITWGSSNASVAPVDASGRVTALVPGAATIVASYRGAAAAAALTVHE